MVVVVSAMSGETDRLINPRKAGLDGPAGNREYDVVISTGEQVTIGLLSLALHSIGCRAKSFLGLQVPIVTEKRFSSARIESIDKKISWTN